ncbi:hypothetical protein A1QO_02455 [Vibrio genomosp. F10 str. ZF-129]|uniref:Uncharacterized protein n=1 Tax=Vibrio genomosp. F10 str. ZF-129 TaxID=1187848 RepID=A0A1E5BK31_9VIBR|nr:hypothetical protein [Vibrio genomosp. F10]OEE38258.1 hypothetical protein A1QO_02455 [Vibrio genomosp. F10 str. ZF-129]
MKISIFNFGVKTINGSLIGTIDGVEFPTQIKSRNSVITFLRNRIANEASDFVEECLAIWQVMYRFPLARSAHYNEKTFNLILKLFNNGVKPRSDINLHVDRRTYFQLNDKGEVIDFMHRFCPTDGIQQPHNGEHWVNHKCQTIHDGATVVPWGEKNGKPEVINGFFIVSLFDHNKAHLLDLYLHGKNEVISCGSCTKYLYPGVAFDYSPSEVLLLANKAGLPMDIMETLLFSIEYGVNDGDVCMSEFDVTAIDEAQFPINYYWKLC